MASSRRIAGFALSAVAAVIVFFATLASFPKPWPELSREELIEEVRLGYVHEVVVIDEEVLAGVSTRSGPFRVHLRRDDRRLPDELSGMGVTVKFEEAPLGLI